MIGNTNFQTFGVADKAVALAPGLEAPKYYILDMPRDVLSAIFFNMKDIFSCSLVCKELYQMIRNEAFCKELYYRNFHAHYPKQDFSTGFYQACKDGYTSRLNLTNGVYGMRTLQGHQRCVESLVIMNGKLCSGSRDRTVKVWDLGTGKCLSTLVGHKGDIFSLAVSNGKLCSSSFDTTIKIWDLESEKCLNTLKGHQSSVFCVTAFDKKLCSSSYDETIRIWDVEKGTCLNTLQANERSISGLAILDEKLYSSVGHIWDLDTGTLLKTIQTFRTEALAIFDRKLYFTPFFKNNIEVRDLESEASLTTSEGHCDLIASFAMFDGRLCSSSFDTTIKIWEPETGRCLTTLKGHRDGVHSLAVLDGKLCSGSSDKTIKIWDFTTEHSVIFEELANLFRSGDKRVINETMERFSRMPNVAKNKIYGELYRILAPFSNDYFGCAEHAFHGQYGLSATPEQKAQAIEKYTESGK